MTAARDRPITVIIPHYDDLERLDRCLGALMSQTIGRNRFDIIIGDNGTPAGIDAVERVVAGRARVIPVAERGAGPARNGAAREARGDMLAFIDSDCLPDPDWLRAGTATLGDCIFVGGRMKIFARDSRRMSGAEAFEMVFGFDNRDYVLRKGFTVTANLFVMRADFERVGGFRTAVSEDLEWCMRARGLGLRIVYAPDAIVSHPARADWRELTRKTERIQDETYALMREAPHSRLRWLAQSLLLPFSIAAHGPRMMSAGYLPLAARWRGMACLARIRLWRFGRGLRLLLTHD